MSFVKFDYIEPLRAFSNIGSKVTDNLKVREPAMHPTKMATKVAPVSRPRQPLR